MEKFTSDILSMANIRINGREDQDITITNSNFYKRVLTEGSLGLGESYMDEWWKCKRIDQFIANIISANLEKKIKNRLHIILSIMKTKIFNLQKVSRAYEVGKKHYDIGNELFKEMLDKRMVYTCAYWKEADTLDEAQEAKLDLVCKKINLKPGMKILDIGCGWGSFAEFAAKNYKVNVVGITISKEQVKLARQFCNGLPVEIRFQDYRSLTEKFDRVVSLGMFEHVGPKNYKTYIKTVYNALEDNGIFLLQTIGKKNHRKTMDPWMDKYIFPNGYLPSPDEITTAINDLFVLEDWHNFGADYDKTLMAWHKNFESGWERIKKKYDTRFKRMWEYYLLACAGGFRSRNLQLWQIVLSKEGIKGGYTSIR